MVYTCRAMLTIKKLTKAHAGRTLFFETELVVNWGERIALVGPNGAGKSTLFRMIRGDDTPDEGQIVMDDYAVVGYLQQEAGDPTDRTVLEIAMSVTPEMAMPSAPCASAMPRATTPAMSMPRPWTPSFRTMVTRLNPRPSEF